MDDLRDALPDTIERQVCAKCGSTPPCAKHSKTHGNTKVTYVRASLTQEFLVQDRNQERIRSERLDGRLQSALKVLRESAEAIHFLDVDPTNHRGPFLKCRETSCQKARALLGKQRR